MDKMRVATDADIKIGQHVMIKYDKPGLADDVVEGRHFYYMSWVSKVYQMGVVEVLNGSYNKIETTCGDVIIPTNEQIADYQLFMKFYTQYEKLFPVDMENMTPDQECDCLEYATKQFIKSKPKKNQTEYGKEAERLIQLHIDAGLTEEQAWKAAIITLEYYGCSKQGNSRIDSLKQKAYNYLTGVGKVTKSK